MKKQQQNKIGLKKLTIARINPDAMSKIIGGDCVVTEDETSIFHLLDMTEYYCL